ncbi:MAG: FtsQ-type POTRA domain-containing protein [Candidatus Aminicenantes bacterium]|nr:FtsQ-type POTRA domain-containing protein [Candidatus Aminicenantes bacterium]
MGGSLKFEADFFRRNNNLTVTREKRIRSIQVRTIHLLLLLALVLLTGLVLSRAADFLFTWDALQVRTYRFRQQPVFASDAVAGILRRFGGNILALDLGEMRRQLLQVPEIAAVFIRRVLPDTVEIDFSLRRPFYQYQRDGVYHLLDAEGLLLGQRAQATADLVPVNAMGADLEAIVPYSGELRPLRGRIEHVAYGEPHGVEVKLRGAPEIFYPGESDFVGKINLYFRIRNRLPLDVSSIRRVDLRIPGRIYLEFKDVQRGGS